MDQLRPLAIPQPEHGAALATEAAFRRTDGFLSLVTFDRAVFSWVRVIL
jgi:hypothetical protein